MSSQMIKVKIKKLQPHAMIPQYADEGSAGLDLIAIDMEFNRDYGYYEYGTGLAIEIPEGYEGQIRPRSSISKYDVMLCNPPGTIDSSYRGEVLVRFKPTDGERSQIYAVGEKVAQLVIKPVPKVEFQEVEELSETQRGTGGFGSTGK